MKKRVEAGRFRIYRWTRARAGKRTALAFLLVLASVFFATLPKVLASHPKVDLLTVDSFAVLAGSAITDTGATAITGDVGLSPAGGASITGLTCAEVTGTIYDKDGGYTGGGGGSTACRVTDAGLLATAKYGVASDFFTAYSDAASRTTTSIISPALGGITLMDGTYESLIGTFDITGTLTLDGRGDPNAVFIFKMASNLETAPGSEVALINGAQACNVFWQVGDVADLGTNSIFKGNILALRYANLNTGANVEGLVSAFDGTVTLDSNTITRATCLGSSNARVAPEGNRIPWSIVVLSGIFTFALISFGVVLLRKRAI